MGGLVAPELLFRWRKTANLSAINPVQIPAFQLTFNSSPSFFRPGFINLSIFIRIYLYLSVSILFPIQSSAYFSLSVSLYSFLPLSLSLSLSLFLFSRIFPNHGKSLLSPRLILRWLSSSLTRCIRQQCAFPESIPFVPRIYVHIYICTHTLTHTQVENYRSIFIHARRSTFILFGFSLSFFLFFFFSFFPSLVSVSPVAKHAFVSQTILLSSGGRMKPSHRHHRLPSAIRSIRVTRNYERVLRAIARKYLTQIPCCYYWEIYLTVCTVFSASLSRTIEITGPNN